MRVRLPEASLAAPSLWPALPDLRGILRDECGIAWAVEWRSDDGNVARLRAGGLVRTVTRERVADWTREGA